MEGLTAASFSGPSSKANAPSVRASSPRKLASVSQDSNIGRSDRARNTTFTVARAELESVTQSQRAKRTTKAREQVTLA